jgi:ribose transport system substrate-binding protein
MRAIRSLIDFDWSAHLQILQGLILATLIANLNLGTACAEPNERAGDAGSSDSLVLLVLPTIENPFFVELEKGFRAGFSQTSGIRIEVRAAAKDSEITVQRQVLTTYFSKYVEGTHPSSLKAVALVPAGSRDELTSQIRSLRERDVPVFLLDGKIERDALVRAHTDYTAYVGSSNRDGGLLGAKLLGRCLPKGGSVLVLNGPPGSEPAAERRAGFMTGVTELKSEKGVNFTVTERIGNWQKSEGNTILDGLLSLGRNFDGIFAANDMMALGAVEAIRTHPEVPRPVVIGFDAVDDARVAVEKGLMAGTVAQDPFLIGKKGAELILSTLRGEVVTKDNSLPVVAVTQKGSCADR